MLVPIIIASPVDQDHADIIITELDKWGIAHKLHVASAHKVPEKVLQIVSDYNDNEKVACFVTIAGRSNGLSGVVGANSIHPVIACPPMKDKHDFMININSTLMMPSETPVLTVCDPKNVAPAIARIFGLVAPVIQERVREKIKEVKDGFK